MKELKLLDNTSIKVLSKLQKAFPNSKSVVRGGYLRDLFIGRKPDDIDVLTDIGYKDLQKVFKGLNWSDGGLKLGITWTKFQNKDVQFSTVPTDDFEEELTNVDLTMNSMYKSTLDRKSTRLNSSHVAISYAVYCLKKKMQKWIQRH